MKLTRFALSIALALGAGMPVAASAAPAPAAAAANAPFLWQNATVYFLLTDRFSNGNPANDRAYGRQPDAAPMRGYLGGDLAGITAKIREGYFRELGVDVLWITPPVEQIHGATDEGTGRSYGFHGYWARDWTSIDASLGTEADMRELVDTAHAHGLRVLLDVVMNHTGPVTALDPAWPADWVRMGPACTYKDAATTINCVLVENLPDIRTDSNAEVSLPPALVAKWQAEGRLEKEVRELDAFFARTGWPRAPRYYLMKWHADWVRKYGIDGFRADTVKHTEPGVWKELRQVAGEALAQWRQDNPGKAFGNAPFYMTGEIYNYTINDGLRFDMGGGETVNFFAHGFDSLINFGFKNDARQSYEALFSGYAARLQGPLQPYSMLNYLSSHDDGEPFDLQRSRPFEAATKLLLSPGAAQIYYGDETARTLTAAGASGDATLRAPMNWQALADNALQNGYRIAALRRHWSRLGQFRHAHPAVGAGQHARLAERPYTFKRTLDRDGVHDRVVVALDVPGSGSRAISVKGVFADGEKVKDYYSGRTTVVAQGKARFGGGGAVVLIGLE